jgi:adenosine deaminase
MTPEARHDFIATLPLAELHRHFDGACRPSTLWEYSEKYYRAVPGLDFEEFRTFLQWNDAKDRNLLDYLSKFDLPLQYTQFYENINRIAYEIAEDAYEGGVRILELRTNPFIHRRAGLSTRQVVHATRKGLARFGEEHPDFRAGINIIAMRNHGGNMARILLREVIGEHADYHNGPGVIGFDIAGAEPPFPPVLFARAYDLARKMNLGLTVHAGEAAGPERVWEAVESLGPQRIGHGTSAGRDPELIKRLARDGIVVECCLTSNIHTGAIDRYEDHPLPKFLDAGVRVALCTDNPTVSSTTLRREYAVAMETFGFSEDDMRRIASMSWEGSFLAEAGAWPVAL